MAEKVAVVLRAYKMKTNTINILALSKVRGIGNVTFKKNIEKINILQDDSSELFAQIAKKIDKNEIQSYLDSASKLYEYCDLNNIKILTINNKHYPQTLLEIKNPPKVIFYKGDINLTKNAIGIIGTRKSTKIGNLIAHRVSSYFSSNWSVCNGFADGIDSSCVEYGNKILSNCIGVVSGGLDFENSTLSKSTRLLAEKSLENNGLLISEVEPSQKEDKFSLINACRIQAGLSLGLILIQSSDKGGSRFTIKSFCETKRILGIIDFSKSADFLNSEFEANRVIIKNQMKGVANFCEIENINDIKLKKIILISEKKEYEIIENEIKKSHE